jgi:hypothetical protein
MAAPYELVLDRDYVGIRQRIARPRPAAARVAARPAPISIRLSPLARALKLVRQAYLGGAALAVLALVGTLLADGGWQAVAAAGAISTGLGALIAFMVAVTLADGLRSR